jgi:DNA-binding CsgD family transcriptional regulator/tetratricopeptide (TPR) repeat protein
MTLAFAAEWDRARSVLADTVAACERAAPAMLPYPLTAQGWLERGTGQWTAAAGDLELAIERSRETGRANDETWAHSILAWICAARGQAGQVEMHVARQLELAERLGLPYQALTTDAARGLLALGAGEAADAIPALQRALDRKRALGFCDATTHPSLTPDLVEALVRCDRRDEAAELTDRFEQEASRPGGRALALRCRGLLAPDDDASELFDQAAELHRLADDPFGLARTQLAHGERLRRAGQRKRSRELLDAAREGFTALDAVPWMARTDEEDGRSARVLRSDPADRDELTPSEHQVASLAVRGLQNREIAQRLFMSSKTVEAHLTRIYRKVGVRTRVELVHSYRPRPVAAE